MSQRRTIAALLSGSLLAVMAIGALTATSAQAATGCRVDYAVTNQWSTGYGADVTVTNLGDPVSSWNVTWSFTAGQQVTNLWNATVNQSGAAVSVTGLSWNSALGTGGEANFGFNGSWSGSNPAPTSVRMNGVACTGTVPTATPTPTVTPTVTPTATPTVTPTATPTPTPTPAVPAPTGGFYVNPTTQAATAAAAATGQDKALLNKIAQNPAGYWIGSWATAAATKTEVKNVTSAAASQGKTALLVVYAIPGRDCGNYIGGRCRDERVRRLDRHRCGGHRRQPVGRARA